MIFARNHAGSAKRAVSSRFGFVRRNRRLVSDSEKENLTIGKIKTRSNCTTANLSCCDGSVPHNTLGSDWLYTQIRKIRLALLSPCGSTANPRRDSARLVCVAVNE